MIDKLEKQSKKDKEKEKKKQLDKPKRKWYSNSMKKYIKGIIALGSFFFFLAITLNLLQGTLWKNLLILKIPIQLVKVLGI
jgi:uncharacterized membrane protein